MREKKGMNYDHRWMSKTWKMCHSKSVIWRQRERERSTNDDEYSYDDGDKYV